MSRRLGWAIGAIVVLIWAYVHLVLLQHYIADETSIDPIIKAFILDHIIWWYIAPFFYFVLGIVFGWRAFFNPDAELGEWID